LAQESDPHKIVEPMEVGLELLMGDLQVSDSLEALKRYSRHHLASSEQYFACDESGVQYLRRDDRLLFSSPIHTETPANRCAGFDIFESNRRERAIILLPHWNASRSDYRLFAEFLRLWGVTVLCMSLPYHDDRRPESQRIDRLMVSSNLGRTIRSCRQAVLEARLAIGWLQQQGYRRIGVVGSSLGSSIAAIVAAHDQRVRVVSLLLVASDFGEVVWTGRATRHIRQALEGRLTLPQLKEIWSVISPVSYLPRLRGREVSTLVISGREDEVFQPYLTTRFIEALREHSIPFRWNLWPCGHYTMGTFPFNLGVLITVTRFLHNHL
jgi:pimeloyl-ACP methyl ester carboxylesterase